MTVRWPLGALVLALWGCRGGPPNPYPSEVVETFVASCRTNAAESVCRCAIDRIQRRWSLDEFRAFEARMADGAAPKELVDTAAECRGR
jgi:hypothetical protein